MGLLSLFTGKPPEEMEADADSYFASGEYGAAKVEYERALDKAEKKSPEKEPLIRRLREKVSSASRSLALSHVSEAAELAESECFQQAEDLLGLALELAGGGREDAEVKKKAEDLRRQIRGMRHDESSVDQEAPEDQQGDEHGGEDYFHALLSTLPQDIRTAYEGYGSDFREGYILLNQGYFERAVQKFREAVRRNPAPDSLVPLELATAHMHLSQFDEARSTMESYVRNNPESLRGIQLLCDIYWETGDYQAAEDLLSDSPQALKETQGLRMLLGETFYLAGRYEDARDVFLECSRMPEGGEMADRALAKTYEALGEVDSAVKIYGRILNSCTRRGARMDPIIKQRFAELSFQSGDTSRSVLEMFLSLVQEDPDNRKVYYDRIARIYEAGGNPSEAERYRGLES